MKYDVDYLVVLDCANLTNFKYVALLNMMKKKFKKLNIIPDPRSYPNDFTATHPIDSNDRFYLCFAEMQKGMIQVNYSRVKRVKGIKKTLLEVPLSDLVY